MGEMIDVPGLHGGESFPAYRADPDGTPRGAIVVIQEVFGVNGGIRRKCDQLAALGYVAIAPELFWRFAKGADLNPDVPEQLQKGLEYFGQFDQDTGIEDLEATIRYARGAAGNRKVGAVGYCLGGRMAYLVASRTDADASVGYYAVGLDDLLHESHAIGKPLLLHVAADDGFVPPAQQKAVSVGLAGNRHVTIHTYPGVDHGFATEEGTRRSPDAADLADGRTQAFFAAHIG